MTPATLGKRLRHLCIKKSTALETSVTLAEKQGGENNDTLGLKSSG